MTTVILLTFLLLLWWWLWFVQPFPLHRKKSKKISIVLSAYNLHQWFSSGIYL